MLKKFKILLILVFSIFSVNLNGWSWWCSKSESDYVYEAKLTFNKVYQDYKRVIDAYRAFIKSKSNEYDCYKDKLLNTIQEDIAIERIRVYGNFCFKLFHGPYSGLIDFPELSSIAIGHLQKHCINSLLGNYKLKHYAQSLIQELYGIQSIVKNSYQYITKVEGIKNRQNSNANTRDILDKLDEIDLKKEKKVKNAQKESFKLELELKC